MTDMDDEAMKAMARRIAEEKSKSHGDGRPLDFQLAYAAALAAIVETRDRDAALAYRVCAETRHVTLGDKVSAAIRSGQQFRKDV